MIEAVIHAERLDTLPVSAGTLLEVGSLDHGGPFSSDPLAGAPEVASAVAPASDVDDQGTLLPLVKTNQVHLYLASNMFFFRQTTPCFVFKKVKNATTVASSPTTLPANVPNPRKVRIWLRLGPFFHLSM